MAPVGRGPTWVGSLLVSASGRFLPTPLTPFRCLFLAAPVCLVSIRAHAERPVSFEVGYQLESFSESFRVGDLLLDLNDAEIDPGLPVDSVLLGGSRVRSEEVLHGAYAEIGWRSAAPSGLSIDGAYEQNERDATAHLRTSGAVVIGRGWTLDGDGRLRGQFGVQPDDRSRDLVTNLGLSAERQWPGLGQLTLLGKQEHSRGKGASDDSLSDALSKRLYDYDLWTVAAKFRRPLREVTSVARLEWARRVSPDAAATATSGLGAYSRYRGELQFYRYAADGWDFDASLAGTRRNSDETAATSPSYTEWSASSSVNRSVLPDLIAGVDAGCQLVDYDIREHDEIEGLVYYDFLLGRGEVGVSWFAFGGASAEIAAGGEWLRPDADSTRAYDQSRLRLSLGYLGAPDPGQLDLWFDLEQAIGYRNYHGSGGMPDPLLAEGALGWYQRDFFYSETTFLASVAWRGFVMELTAQYWIEDHEKFTSDEIEIDEDVSFSLVNLRLGRRF